MPDARNLPLFAWGDTLRTRRARRQRLVRRALIAGAASFALGLTVLVPPPPLLVWNASASAPVGLYAVTPGHAVRRGDMVIARLPVAMRGMAARRRYLPRGVPLVKRVMAGPGDTVCARGRQITIDAMFAAERLVADAAGRPMPWWQGCVHLAKGQAFLLMIDVPNSFDGRYFGISQTSDIVGRAHALWLR